MKDSVFDLIANIASDRFFIPFQVKVNNNFIFVN